MNYFEKANIGSTKVNNGGGSKREYSNKIPGNFLARIDRCKMFKKDGGMGLPAVAMEGEIIWHEDDKFVGTGIQEMADMGKQQMKHFITQTKKMSAITLMLDEVVDSYNPNADLGDDVWNGAAAATFGEFSETDGKPDAGFETPVKGIVIRYANTPKDEYETDGKGNAVKTGNKVEGMYWANMMGPVTDADELKENGVDLESVTGLHPAYSAE
tara:strand:- start:61722 stop:62360 length:639 start_codon:yes stop_codon:yes gene_type:complete